ncbi:expressed unknown protein [Seminavis robusta]|uniref:Uncharacterized protein n=1 Tax=Seminavis robusta TaxID=568900 RepID=A0A9N8DCY2_9STRA|nr:expressed unknown protein [Seminavis robusta]|eukprot:Sro89_g047080.1 n/a (277) ;mRNA; f:100482-101312
MDASNLSLLWGILLLAVSCENAVGSKGVSGGVRGATTGGTGGGRGVYVTGSSRKGNTNLYLFALIVLFPLLLVGIVFVNRSYQRKRLAQFQQEVELAKADVHDSSAATQMAKKNGARPSIQLASGSFASSYNNSLRGNAKFASNGTISFERNLSVEDTADLKGKSQHFASIAGRGEDDDGPFEIVQGLASQLSGKCYWIQREAEHDYSGNANEKTTKTGTTTQKRCRYPWARPQREVLVAGTFHNAAGSAMAFSGRWWNSNGASGSFTEFRIGKAK